MDTCDIGRQISAAAGERRSLDDSAHVMTLFGPFVDRALDQTGLGHVAAGRVDPHRDGALDLLHGPAKGRARHGRDAEPGQKLRRVIVHDRPVDQNLAGLARGRQLVVCRRVDRIVIAE